jgi:hypothetical protein
MGFIDKKHLGINTAPVRMSASPNGPQPLDLSGLREHWCAMAEEKAALNEQQKDSSFFGFKPRREIRSILRSGDVPGSAGDRAFAALHDVEV